jgi:hypothetical protein
MPSPRDYTTMTQREQELHGDLDVTELRYKVSKSNAAKQAINKLRYLLIVELHDNKDISL